MGHHDVLSAIEFERHMPNYRMLEHMFAYLQSNNLRHAEANILDYGCERGQDVLWLRNNGLNAFGIDIDAKSIANGQPLFITSGHPKDCIRVINDIGVAAFPNSFFNFTFSQQTFEHVYDLSVVAKELYRLSIPGGMGYHRYSANKRIIEEHLKMPLVHWLPKNNIRRSLIQLYVSLGVEPEWELHDNEQKCNCYFNYSVKNTFYRSYLRVKRIFEHEGFIVTFAITKHPKLISKPLLARFAASNLFRPLVEAIMLTFVSVELILKKP